MYHIQKIEAQERKEHYPQGEENLTVEYSPAICKVGTGKKFQSKGKLDKAEGYLDNVHPTARAGHLLEH